MSKFVVVVIGVLVLSVFSAAQTARADIYGTGGSGSGYKPDNSAHTFCFDPSYSSITGQNNARASAGTLDNQTTMFDTQVPSCTGTSDALWRRTYDGVDGSYTCLALNGAGECESSAVRVNFENMDSYDDWRQTTCHELGHSVGLNHASDDCMGTDEDLQSYSVPHHVDHINNER